MDTRASVLRIDWWQVFEDLRRADYSTYDISGFTGIPRSSLMGYKNLAQEPDHWRGERILGIWVQVTQRPVDEAPRKPLDLSAAKARR